MIVVTMRRADSVDLARMVALLADDALGRSRETVADYGDLPDSYRAAFAAIMVDPNNCLYVAEADGEVVGCLQLTFIPGLSYQGAWRAQIEGVRVANAYRAQRIGAQMIEFAIERAREWGCRTVQLTSNKARAEAHRFYAGLGFQATHEGFKLDLLDRPAAPVSDDGTLVV